MKEIKTSENVEFDVIYADGNRYHAKEGVLIEAEGDRINLHLGTSRVAVVFAAVEALMEAIGDAGLMDVFKRYIDSLPDDTKENSDAGDHC